MAGPLIALGGAVFATAATVFELGRRARFEAHGRLLTAEVTKVEETYDWVVGAGQVYDLSIFYRFLTPTGEERAGEVMFTDDRYPFTDRYPVPSQGDQLATLYVDGIEERVM